MEELAKRKGHTARRNIGARRLPRGMAPVNHQIAARHEATSIAQQKQPGALELTRCREPAHHILPTPHPLQLGVLLHVPVYHRGHDVARADAVDADAARAILLDRRPFHG